jgi:plastocyanin
LARGTLLAALAAVLAAGAAALPATAAAPKRSARVVLKDIALHPARVVIARGGTVTWAFRDAGVTHNVTSRGGHRFKGSGNRQGGSYRVRFTKKGTYRYECTIHPGAMDGTVVVR